MNFNSRRIRINNCHKNLPFKRDPFFYKFHNKSLFKPIFIILILFFILNNFILAQDINKEKTAQNDWPMYRYDAQRSGYTKSALPEKLKPLWTRSFPALSPVWPDEGKFQFDSNYHPIVMGKNIFITSPNNDCLYAISTSSGEVLWKFFADAPIRFAPAGSGDKIYFVSDDSYLYCLQASTGKFLWKYRGAPNDSKILVSGRLASPWPARSGPAVFENKVFFTAGIWPFMGSFIYALDAETGKFIWSNSGSGSIYATQAHSSPAFAGVAPQGYITVTKDILIIPNGKSAPSTYDTNSGILLYSNFKSGGDFYIPASDKYYINRGAVFALQDSKHLGNLGYPQIITPDYLYAGSLQSFDLKNIPEQAPSTDPKAKPVLPLKQLWTESLKVNIQFVANNRLYAFAGKSIMVYDLPEFKKEIEKPQIAYQLEVNGTIAEIIGADNKLFAITMEGDLICFGDESTSTPAFTNLKETPKPIDENSKSDADTIISTTNFKEGYAIALGVGSGQLVEDLFKKTKLSIIVIEPNIELVKKFRIKWDEAQIYGPRLVIHHSNPFEFSLPAYIANFIVSENLDFSKENLSQAIPKIFHALRPYGGTACLKIPANLKEKWSKEANNCNLPKAIVSEKNGLTLLTREGALIGAGSWTHQYGDSASTVMSKDEIVKLPLGLLWFGGPSNKNTLPRHGHGPNPQVVGGRVVTQGANSLQAYDAYTGRLFWEIELPGIGKAYDNTSHQPGANSIGSNYVSLADFIYAVQDGKCKKIEASSGKIMETFALPPLEGQTKPAHWGFIATNGDFLIASAEPLSGDKGRPGDWSWNGSTGKAIVVLNRHNGKLIWKKEAEHGFRHNTIVIGNEKVFAIDMIPKEIQLIITPNKTDGIGKIVAFDLKTGNMIWNTDQGVFGTFLNYSEEHDILLQAGRASRDMLKEEVNNRMSAIAGKDGKILWDKPNSFSGPCLILGKDILAQGNGFNLLDGEPKMIKSPISDTNSVWGFGRAYGCNTAIGSKNLLTFRSAAAGYFNLENNSGTGNFGGFKSGCTSNLIIADGLLNAPDYTRTCTCSYQNRATLALIHQPDVETWTNSKMWEWKGQKFTRLGINFGAPGDRQSETNTYWMKYPGSGLPIKISPSNLTYYCQHASFAKGPELSWVASSGVKGISTFTCATGNKENIESLFTVRLIFCELEPLNQNERLMDISIQKKVVFEGLDIVKEASGTNKVLIKEIKNLKLNHELQIELKVNPKATKQETILSGIEIIAE